MKIVIDMNLTPQWVAVLQQAGYDAVHWSTVGHPAATDQTIMQWARAHEHIVFTHDLDFGALLTATNADGPSVSPGQDTGCAAGGFIHNSDLGATAIQ